MKAEISSEIQLAHLLHNMGIPAEAVLVLLDGNLVPETAIAKKGQEAEILFYKHVPPLLSPQEPSGHWKNAKPSVHCTHKSQSPSKTGGKKGASPACPSVPVIYLPYAKEHLCKKHFCGLFEKRVKRTIRNYSMLNAGEKVGIALSGGKDSFALLHALNAVRKSLPFELTALTIDEGIPGYRDAAIENASRRCRELDIEQHVFSFKEEYGTTISEIGKKGKENLCSYCGVLRRKILNIKARELGIGKIATGHNLDDVAQTAFLNLIRNEPLRFARFNEPISSSDKFVQRIRPLREIREKEVAAYALLNGHSYNSGCCCPNARNALRWSVRHSLNSLEDSYPGTKSKVASSFNSLQKIVRDSLRGKSGELLFCKECGEPSSTELCMACRMLGGL
ncbi:TIGR00269 family protein [Candidatus Micrarchaeota archaeon]|nr:TIGR00269 family protein [Candidatus Micrarchaeota archaeon]